MKLVSDRTGWWLAGAHILAAALWLLAMPGGFGVDHPRFWMNRVLPLALIGGGVGAVVSGWRGDRRWLRALIVLLAAFWLAVAGVAVAIYPISCRKIVPPGLLIAGVLWASVLTGPMRTVGLRRWPWVAAVILGLGAGGFAVWSQRAPSAATAPLDEPMPRMGAGTAVSGSLVFGQGASISAGSGDVHLQRGRYSLMLSPMLSFMSRSPDRSWTNLAPARDREGPVREFRHAECLADGSVRLWYADGGQSAIDAREVEDGELEITAWSSVPAPVYSHLNTYTQILFAGHRRLQLAFSPCGMAGAEPMPMEYPIGAPARSAAMFHDGRFQVMQASSAEKGPYSVLLSGQLQRGQPLEITVRDEGQDVLAITWFDFSSQASTQLSPTAGYGLPANAIEFSLSDRSAESPMQVFMTLASTSMGRGWDSLGHCAGVYRNRMRVRWMVR